MTFLEVDIKVPKYEMHLVSHQPHTGAGKKERKKLSGFICNIVEESKFGPGGGGVGRGEKGILPEGKQNPEESLTERLAGDERGKGKGISAEGSEL